MTTYLNAENFFNRGFDLLQPRVTEFYHLTCIGKYDVVMLLVEVALLVKALVLTKLVFAHQVAIQQQLNGVVQGCA